jgi:hypothetical protein
MMGIEDVTQAQADPHAVAGAAAPVKLLGAIHEVGGL